MLLNLGIVIKNGCNPLPDYVWLPMLTVADCKKNRYLSLKSAELKITSEGSGLQSLIAKR